MFLIPGKLYRTKTDLVTVPGIRQRIPAGSLLFYVDGQDESDTTERIYLRFIVEDKVVSFMFGKSTIPDYPYKFFERA